MLAQKKIKEIYEITSQQKKWETNDLLDGYAGVYLFNRSFEKRKKIRLSRFNNNNIISNKDNFGLGFSGQIWVNLYFNSDTISRYSSFLRYLKKSTSFDLNNNHYNLVYGGIGKLICLLESNKKTQFNKKTYNLFATQILDNALLIGNGKVWLNQYYCYDFQLKNEINISMTQGIASIISALCRLFHKVSKNIQIRIQQTLMSSMQWLKDVQYEKIIGCKIFPTHYYSQNENYIYFNRIGWAYGDITLCLAIYRASIICNCESTKDYALSKCRDIADLKNTDLKYCNDASISQGTSGLAHIFNRLYKETGINKFNDARHYWLEETLSLAKYDDGLAGYKSWTDHEKGFQKNIGFFDGIAGIGLVLLGFLTDDVEDLDWDRCLLLS